MGRYLYVGSTIESTYGTAPVGQVMVPARATSVARPVDRGIMMEENIDNYISTAGYGGALKLSGTIEGNLRPIQMGTLFWCMMGASAATSTPFTGFAYTLDLPQSTDIRAGEQTITAGGHDMTYVGVGIKTASLEFASKEFVKAKFDWLARDFTKAAYAPPTATLYGTEGPLVFYAATIGLDGTQAINVKNVTIDIDRKLDEEQYCIGEFKLRRLTINGMTEIGGTLTFTEQEYDQLHRAYFGSAGATSVPAGNSLGAATLSIQCKDNTNATLVFQIDTQGMLYATADSSMTGQDEIEKKVEFKVTGTTFKISVKNP